MTKKTKKRHKRTKAESQAPEPTIPGGRESFLPTPDPPPEPVAARAEAVSLPDIKTDDDEALTVGPLSLELTYTNDRRVHVTVAVPPLDPVTHSMFMPSKISREKAASVIGGVIRDIGGEIADDGLVQHHKRLEEERESKERYSKR